MSPHEKALREIVDNLTPPVYGRTWCEHPCCCPGDCVGCKAEQAYKTACAALGIEVKS